MRGGGAGGGPKKILEPRLLRMKVPHNVRKYFLGIVGRVKIDRTGHAVGFEPTKVRSLYIPPYKAKESPSKFDRSGIKYGGLTAK